MKRREFLGKISSMMAAMGVLSFVPTKEPVPVIESVELLNEPDEWEIVKWEQPFAPYFLDENSPMLRGSHYRVSQFPSKIPINDPLPNARIGTITYSDET